MDVGGSLWHPVATAKPVERGVGTVVSRPQLKDIVSCQGVSLRYGSGPVILDNITLSVQSRSFYFLTGASGAGKSTFIRMLTMSLKPCSGILKIYGHDAAQLSREKTAIVRQRMGVVFQDFNLLNHLTVLQNVMLPLRIQGLSEQTGRKQAVELLEWVGLEKTLEAYPLTLSGGERQRVAIARAVITRPALLLADEPTGSVDEKMGLRLFYLFDELHRLGTSVIFATHHRDFARVFGYPEIKVADQKVWIEEGTRPAHSSGPAEEEWKEPHP
jgi:cell division transport system ATP-binding protein